MQTRFSPIAWMLLAICLTAATPFVLPAHADDDEVWWESAQRDATRDGYVLIDTEGVSKIMKSPAKTIILDARADYEFEAGHIPGAVNLEFDLGDRTSLSDAKREAMVALLGPDKKQRIVIYCRSFR